MKATIAVSILSWGLVASAAEPATRACGCDAGPGALVTIVCWVVGTLAGAFLGIFLGMVLDSLIG